MPPLFKLCFPFALNLAISAAGQILSMKRQFVVTSVEHFFFGRFAYRENAWKVVTRDAMS